MIEFYINENGIACVPLKMYNDSLEENERLNNIIKEAREYIRKQTHDEDTGNYLGYPDLIDDEHLLNIL